MPAEEPRKHHYLPQFYLKEFADDRNRLNICSRSPVRVFASSVTNVAAERDYYTIDAENPDHDRFAAEKLISEVESQHAGVLSRALGVDILDNDLASELVGFAQFMHYRVAKIRDMIFASATAGLEMFTEHLEQSGKFAAMPEELRDYLAGRSVVELFKPTPKNWFVVLEMLKLGSDARFFQLMMCKRTTLFVAAGFQKFITGDSPVAIWDHMFGKSSVAGGLASPSSEISFPLSPTRLLLISDNAPGGVVKLNDSGVRAFNRRLIVWTERYLFTDCFHAVTLRDVLALAGRQAGYATERGSGERGPFLLNRMTPVHPALVAL